MKIGKWFIFSVGIHLVAFASIAIAAALNLQPKKETEYVMLQDYQPPSPVKKNTVTPAKPPEQKELGGLKVTDKPETNVSEQAAEPSGTGDYVASYLVEDLPVALSPIQPAYPEDARRAGIEGRVLMLIYIDETGTVRKVEVQKSPSQSLSESAVKTMTSTRFKPARIGGSVKPVVMQFSLRFKLD